VTEETRKLVRHEIRSPRAAAVAGIVFSLLMSAIMILTFPFARNRPGDVTGELLEAWSGTASLVLTLVPFAGIAFLWFTGVIRDRLRDREDRFFGTIFFGSGIILVGLWFTWGAVFGAIMATRTAIAAESAASSVYVFALGLMNEIIGDFTLRMAGVYMTAIASLWTRARIMPRWLTITTYILALGFLAAAPRVREARFIFPAWVFVVSVYVLALAYRLTRDPEALDRLSEAG